MRNHNTIRLLCVVIALAFGWRAFDEPASNAAGAYSRQAQVDFERDIRPLLHARCVECHGANKQQSGLRLDHKAGAMKGGVGGAVIVPGSSATSKLIRRVSSADKSEMMPPSGNRLRAAFEGVTHGERALATPEAKARYAAAARPLEERRAGLTREKAELEKSLAAGAKERAAQVASYPLPKITRHFNEHSFAPVEARYLKFRMLALWTTEFGRMPTHQEGTTGRDHNPDGFTVWLMGAGVKGGTSYGATDELGRRAVENIATVYDFYATVLRLLGLDHERLTYYHNGTNRRLTDVHGHVIRDVLA